MQSVQARGRIAPMAFDLISPLPLRECVRRLRAATDGAWSMRGTKPVQGTVRDTAVCLRKRMYNRNALQCWLSGKLTEENGHTRLHCAVGMHPLFRVFLEMWVSGVVVISGAVLIKNLRLWLDGQGPLSANEWLALGVPLVMLGFGLLLLLFGDKLSTDEPTFLLEFLEHTIAAREEEPRNLRE
jgi:hypothetical protein